jgi:hypothetical protein
MTIVFQMKYQIIFGPQNSNINQMSNTKGPQLIEFGGSGDSYWGQVQCPECEAWLKEMPDHYEAIPYEDEEENEDAVKIDTEYIYYWTCLKCGYQRKLDSFDAPGEHSPHPDGVKHEPGSFPEPVIRDPGKWKGSDRLSEWEKKLVVYCWAMIDSLEGSFLIHKVSYIWKLAASLESYKIEEVKQTAKEYVDLLDYEKIHGQESGSYGGDEGDVTRIRGALEEIAKS